VLLNQEEEEEEEERSWVVYPCACQQKTTLLKMSKNYIKLCN